MKEKEISIVTGVSIIFVFSLLVVFFVFISREGVFHELLIFDKERDRLETAREKSLYGEREEWEKYKNTEWGFEFEYPGDLELKIEIDDPQENMFSISLKNEEVFRINIYDIEMKEYLVSRIIKGTEEDVRVGGHPGKFFHIEDQTGEEKYIPKTVIEKSNTLFSFVGEEEIFKRILSTFSFLE